MSKAYILIFLIFKEKRLDERGVEIIFEIFFFHFRDENYEARDYNENRCFLFFLIEGDFKK